MGITEKLQAQPVRFPGLEVLDPAVVYLMACMKFEQFCCTWRSLEDPGQFCPFCPMERMRRKRTQLKFSGHWMLLENEFPRPDVERMLLIVPNWHAVTPKEIGFNDWQNVAVLFRASAQYGFTSGALLMRYGDPRDHAGTIEHLHFNVIKPVREGGCSLPIAKTPASHAADYARLQGFVAEVNRRGGERWLFSQAGVTETQPTMK